MRDVFFVDSEGNIIYSEEIESHIGLADEIIRSDESLSEEYKKCNGCDMVDFLIENRGYIKVSDIHFYKALEYYGPKTSYKQKKIIMAYYEQGFRILDLAARKKQREDDGER